MRESTLIPQALCLSKGRWMDRARFDLGCVGMEMFGEHQVMWLAVSLETDRKVYRFLMDSLDSLVTSVNVANKRN